MPTHIPSGDDTRPRAATSTATPATAAAHPGAAAAGEDWNGAAGLPDSAEQGKPSSFPFEAMNLKVGDRIQAQPPAKITQERSFIKLLGFLPEVSLMVTPPTGPNGLRLQFLEGEELIIRVFSGQNAFGFSSAITRVCKLPFPYLHLTFPAEVQGAVIRKAPRVRTKIIAQVSAAASGAAGLPGVISNLSANGALLDARTGLAQKGDAVELQFKVKVHGVDAALSLHGRVRSVFSDDLIDQTHASLAHYGLEFENVNANDQMILQALIYQHMIESPQSLI